jgi:predicted Zn-dependent protease
MAAVALLPAYLLFTAHSAFVHYHAGEGERLLVAGARESRGSAARDAQLEASLVHLQRAQRWGLVDSAWLEEQLGQLLFDRGELAASERHLRRAIELLPDGRSARVYLAEVLLAEGELDPALDVLTELVELDPTQPHAARILQRLVQTRPATAERARALLERASAARAN